MAEYLVISAIGEDRPGLVSRLTGVIAEHGCNVEDSRMSVLGTEFAVILLLSGEGEAVQRLHPQPRGRAEAAHDRRAQVGAQARRRHHDPQRPLERRGVPLRRVDPRREIVEQPRLDRPRSAGDSNPRARLLLPDIGPTVSGASRRRGGDSRRAPGRSRTRAIPPEGSPRGSTEAKNLTSC